MYLKASRTWWSSLDSQFDPIAPAAKRNGIGPKVGNTSAPNSKFAAKLHLRHTMSCLRDFVEQ
jgi:hypothetical protein